MRHLTILRRLTVSAPLAALVMTAVLAAGDDHALALPGDRVRVVLPPGLTVAAASDRTASMGSPPPCDAGFSYCFYSAVDPPGAHLRSVGLAVTHRSDLRSLASCLLAQPDGWRDLQPGVVLGPDVVAGSLEPALAERLGASRFGDVGQAAAGSFTLGELFRLFDGERCWEFETRVGSVRPQEPPTPAEAAGARRARDEADALLAAGIAGVRLDGRPVAWPEAGMGALEAFVRVDLPSATTSPLVLRGEARGPWYFEGSFPALLLAEDGTELSAGFVTAQGEWMTEGFVPFEGVLEFDVDEPTRAVLVLMRDNPSDLPQNDAAVRYALELLPQ